jgi:hypothetical protein
MTIDGVLVTEMIEAYKATRRGRDAFHGPHGARHATARRS